jgi:hypothetical protein
MIDKGDIPSIQRKMSLGGPKSMRKVDGLNLIFIHFYVPALTPCLNSTETSLQLSENITLFAVCRIHVYIQVSSAKIPRYTPDVWGVSFMYRLYNVGDRTEPCGTPACISLGVYSSPSTETLNFI